MEIEYTYFCLLSATHLLINKLTEINLSFFSCIIFDNYGDVRVINSFYKIEKKRRKRNRRNGREENVARRV